MFSYGYHPDSLKNTFSQGYVLENNSSFGNGEKSIHSKHRGKGEEPPLA